ncbi:MAG: glycoside hydrolase family 140 protein [Pyrinomonadaceae bacterium]
MNSIAVVMPRVGYFFVLRLIGFCMLMSGALVVSGGAQTPVFPLKVSANKRYLVDQREQPFLYHADTAWRMAFRLRPIEVEQYLEHRQAQGFNTVHLHAINKEKEGTANVHGDQPFDPPGDITRPHEPYWKNLDQVVRAATGRGFLVVISASWFGYNGSGWRKDLTPEATRSYGRFLGNRYREFKNIMWIQGGDNNPGDKAEAAQALAEGIRETSPHQLQTFHAGPEHPSAEFFHQASWLDINLAYTYEPAYRQISAEYNRRARLRPIVLGETGYEGEANTGFPWTPYLVRRQAYWALLSGAAGHAYGSATIWHFGKDWQDALDKPGTRQMAHIKTLFAARPWHKLVPDQKHAALTAGYEAGATYASAARTDDGRLILAYLPTSRAVTINLSKLSGPTMARWYDPTDGRFHPIEGSPFANQGSKQFTPPEANSAGEHDFILVLEVSSKKG